LQNIATLKVAGADAFAVINALFGVEDITQRAQQFKQVIYII
jgi:thiamine monophosphate synthase